MLTLYRSFWGWRGWWGALRQLRWQRARMTLQGGLLLLHRETPDLATTLRIEFHPWRHLVSDLRCLPGAVLGSPQDGIYEVSIAGELDDAWVLAADADAEE